MFTLHLHNQISCLTRNFWCSNSKNHIYLKYNIIHEDILSKSSNQEPYIILYVRDHLLEKLKLKIEVRSFSHVYFATLFFTIVRPVKKLTHTNCGAFIPSLEYQINTEFNCYSICVKMYREKKSFHWINAPLIIQKIFNTTTLKKHFIENQRLWFIHLCAEKRL